MSRIVFVDIDGVIADSMTWWLKMFNAHNATHFSVEDMVEYDVDNILPARLSVYYHDYRGVVPIAGALNAVGRLRRSFRVVFATSGHGKVWLRSYIDFSEKDFVQIKDKSLLRGFALIDDCPEHVENFDGLGLLLKQPWNNGNTWEEVLDKIYEEKHNTPDRVFFSSTEG